MNGILLRTKPLEFRFEVITAVNMKINVFWDYVTAWRTCAKISEQPTSSSFRTDEKQSTLMPLCHITINS